MLSQWTKSRLYDWHIPRVERSFSPGGGIVAFRVYFVNVPIIMSAPDSMSMPNTMSTIEATHLENTEELLTSPLSESSLQTIQGPSRSDWERLQPIIRRLYIDKGHSLADVKLIMLNEYGHEAT